jgi:hypothetical protein
MRRQKDTNPMSLQTKSGYVASLRCARTASHLHQAFEQLTAATHAAPDRYHQKQLRALGVDLRELAESIAEIVASRKRGGRR